MMYLVTSTQQQMRIHIVDGVANNEPENLNTKTVKRGSKLVYQVWLDTTKFTEANNIQYVGVSDTYDADKLDVNAADIKA